jgi:hypothetical protein
MWLNPNTREFKMTTSLTLQDAKKQFINSDKEWFPKENDDLRIEYIINEYDLLTLCIIHKRMPINITNKLKKLGLIPTKNEVRGWDLFTTTELYKSLVKNKVKTKKHKKPSADATKVYSYPINSGFNKIVEKDMNQKEKALRDEIKYYKENRDQINRIWRLENELAYIKNSIYIL